MTSPQRTVPANFRVASFCKPLLWLCGVVIVALAGGCQAPTPAARFIEQGERMHSGALASTVIADTDLSDYVQEVANRVARAAKAAAPGKVNDAFIAKVRCQLIASNTINVFPTGGTHIYVCNGLFQQCQTEEELAGAIAHAYAHLINLDLEQTKMKPNPAEPLTMVAWDYVVNRYTLGQEQAADKLALEIFAQAGYEPSRFANLFERMESQTGGNVAPDREPLPERAANLQAESSDVRRGGRQFPVADPKTFVSLRERAAQYREPAALTVPLLFIRAIPNCVLSEDTAEQRQAQQRLKPVAPPPQAAKEPS